MAGGQQQQQHNIGQPRQGQQNGPNVFPQVAGFTPQYAGWVLRKVPESMLPAGMETSWQRALQEKMKVSSDELVLQLKRQKLRNEREKTSVQSIYDHLKSEHQRLQIDRLIDEQNQILGQQNRALEWTLAGVEVEWKQIDRWRRQTKLIRVILRTQLQAHILSPPKHGNLVPGRISDLDEPLRILRANNSQSVEDRGQGQSGQPRTSNPSLANLQGQGQGQGQGKTPNRDAVHPPPPLDPYQIFVPHNQGGPQQPPPPPPQPNRANAPGVKQPNNQGHQGHQGHPGQPPPPPGPPGPHNRAQPQFHQPPPPPPPPQQPQFVPAAPPLQPSMRRQPPRFPNDTPVQNPKKGKLPQPKIVPVYSDPESNESQSESESESEDEQFAYIETKGKRVDAKKGRGNKPIPVPAPMPPPPMGLNVPKQAKKDKDPWASTPVPNQTIIINTMPAESKRERRHLDARGNHTEDPHHKVQQWMQPMIRQRSHGSSTDDSIEDFGSSDFSHGGSSKFTNITTPDSTPPTTPRTSGFFDLPHQNKNGSLHRPKNDGRQNPNYEPIYREHENLQRRHSRRHSHRPRNMYEDLAFGTVYENDRPDVRNLSYRQPAQITSGRHQDHHQRQGRPPPQRALTMDDYPHQSFRQPPPQRQLPAAATPRYLPGIEDEQYANFNELPKRQEAAQEYIYRAERRGSADPWARHVPAPNTYLPYPEQDGPPYNARPLRNNRRNTMYA